MKTSEIAYKNLSKDYNRLLELLDKGFFIVGFCSIGLYDEQLRKYIYHGEYAMQTNCKIRHGSYDICNTIISLTEKKEFIINFCKEANFQFFDID